MTRVRNNNNNNNKDKDKKKQEQEETKYVEESKFSLVGAEICVQYEEEAKEVLCLQRREE